MPSRLLSLKRAGGVVLAKVRSAKILDTNNVGQFGQELDEVAAHYAGAHVLLDFERVEYLSSAIITELIRTQKALAKDGGSMAACRLDKRIAEVFSITRIDQVIPVYKSVKEALKQHLKQHGDDEELRALLKGAR